MCFLKYNNIFMTDENIYFEWFLFLFLQVLSFIFFYNFYVYL